MFSFFFFFSSRRRHTRLTCDWSSDVCSSDLADAAHAKRGPAAGTRRNPDPYVIAAAKAQQRRGLAPEMSVDELAARPVFQFQRFFGVRVDELDVNDAFAGEVHAGLRFAFAPQRRRDVADSHDLVDARPEGRLQLAAEGFLPAARLPADDDSVEPGSRARKPLGEIHGVRRGAGERLRRKLLQRREELLRVSHAYRDMRAADRLEGRQRRAGDEGPGAEGRDDALARLEAVLRVGVATDPAPVLDVAFRQRDVERRAARAAGRVDARGLRNVDGGVCPERRMLSLALAQLVLLGKRQRGDVLDAAHRGGRIESGGAQLLAIEGGAFEQPLDLLAVCRRHRCLTYRNLPELRGGVLFLQALDQAVDARLLDQGIELGAVGQHQAHTLDRDVVDLPALGGLVHLVVDR